jgi:hypothetical protein
MGLVSLHNSPLPAKSPTCPPTDDRCLLILLLSWVTFWQLLDCSLRWAFLKTPLHQMWGRRRVRRPSVLLYKDPISHLTVLQSLLTSQHSGYQTMLVFLGPSLQSEMSALQWDKERMERSTPILDGTPSLTDIRNPELFNRNHSFITILFTELIATV